jgi:hypothetical protein
MFGHRQDVGDMVRNFGPRAKASQSFRLCYFGSQELRLDLRAGRSDTGSVTIEDGTWLTTHIFFYVSSIPNSSLWLLSFVYTPSIYQILVLAVTRIIHSIQHFPLQRLLLSGVVWSWRRGRIWCLLCEILLYHCEADSEYHALKIGAVE